jgi:hypothetical protein
MGGGWGGRGFESYNYKKAWPSINPVVGKIDEIIALLESDDFFCEESKGLIVIGTFYLFRTLLS